MLKKGRRKRMREKEKKKVTKVNKKKYIGTKLITNTKKQKLKNLEQSLEFQKYNVKEKKKEKKERKNKQTNKNKVTKIIKKIQVQNR